MTNKCYFLSIIMMTLLYSVINAQQFSHVYNLTNGNEYGKEIFVKNDGYIMLTNSICDPHLVESTGCYTTINLDFEGNVKNDRTFGNWFKFSPKRVIQPLNDDFVIFSADYKSEDISWNIYHMSYQGDSIANYIINDFEEDVVFASCLQIKDDALYLLGRVYSYSGAEDENLVLIKADSEGNRIKEERFQSIALSEYQNVGWDFIKTTDDNFIIALTTLGEDGKYAQLIKFDDELNVLWSRTYNPTGLTNNMPDLAPDKDGDFIFTWGLFTPDIIDSLGEEYMMYGRRPATVHKISAEGDFIWSDTLWTHLPPGTTPASRANLFKVIVTEDGGVVAAGNFYSFASDTEWAYIIKYDSEGNRLWEKVYADETYPGDTYFLDIEEADNGDLVCTGQLWDDNGEFNNATYAWVLRLDSNGCFEPDCEMQDSIQLIQTTSNLTTSVSDLSSDHKSFKKLLLYPNPASSIMTVSFQEPVKNFTWKIIDYFGQVADAGKQISSTSNIKIDVENINTGFYFVEIRDQNGKLTHLEKLVID